MLPVEAPAEVASGVAVLMVHSTVWRASMTSTMEDVATPAAVASAVASALGIPGRRGSPMTASGDSTRRSRSFVRRARDWSSRELDARDGAVSAGSARYGAVSSVSARDGAFSSASARYGAVSSVSARDGAFSSASARDGAVSSASARRELPEVMSSVTPHVSEPVALPHMSWVAALTIAALLRAVECVTLTFELCVTINAVSAVPLAPETALAMEAESAATVGRAEEDATSMVNVVCVPYARGAYGGGGYGGGGDVDDASKWKLGERSPKDKPTATATMATIVATAKAIQQRTFVPRFSNQISAGLGLLESSGAGPVRARAMRFERCNGLLSIS